MAEWHLGDATLASVWTLSCYGSKSMTSLVLEHDKIYAVLQTEILSTETSNFLVQILGCYTVRWLCGCNVQVFITHFFCISLNFFCPTSAHNDLPMRLQPMNDHSHFCHRVSDCLLQFKELLQFEELYFLEGSLPWNYV